MKKIRVLVFGLSPNRGGIETYVYNAYKNLNHNKILFDFVDTSSINEQLAYQEEFEKYGSKVFKITKRTKNLLRSNTDIKNILNKNNYNYVHLHVMNFMWWEPIVLANKYSSAKIIVHSHNSKIDKQEFIKNSILDFLGRKFTKNIPFLKLACGLEAGKYLFNNEKFEIMENGVEIEDYKYSKENRLLIRKKYGIEDDCVLIGHVGNFYIAKNYPKLLSIFFEYNKINSKSKLLLIGNYNNDPSIKNIVQKMGLQNQVIFAGLIKDVSKYYSAFDFFVFPSLYEGLSIAMIEAQMSGLYCYVSNKVDINTKITNNYSIINIDEESSVIAKNISENIKTYNRADVIYDERYDIKNSSKKLQEFYERNCSNE